MRKLDARDPLVLDVHELPRRAGESKKIDITSKLPNPLSNGPVIVPAESEVDLELLLEAVVDGVLVTGEVFLEVLAECSRCLDPVKYEIDAQVTDLYVYEDKEITSDEEADEIRKMQGDLIDLEPALIDAVVLELPIRPLCNDDCLGLCAQCGIRLEEDPEHKHEILDLRWSKLSQLKEEK
ncbi:MAG: hypothetical protein RLY68_62 [Actinomycetota bacterium]|jgi:uncharacterized protein